MFGLRIEYVQHDSDPQSRTLNGNIRDILGLDN